MTPSRRVVILGASNIARNIATVLETARNTLGEPLDLMLAAGHGRSYGCDNRVLLRTLPGILPCRLWPSLAERAPLPIDALVTDVGNDIVYERSPEQIARWVDLCLRRLSVVADRILVTELPMESLRTLKPARFLLMRSVLFPRSRLTYETALRHAEQLNEMVQDLARSHGATLFRPPGVWYGVDPIHIRPHLVRSAWKEILRPWQIDSQREADRITWSESASLRLAIPYSRRIAGVRQQRRQPARKLRDGSAVSFY